MKISLTSGFSQMTSLHLYAVCLLPGFALLEELAPTPQKTTSTAFQTLFSFAPLSKPRHALSHSARLGSRFEPRRQGSRR